MILKFKRDVTNKGTVILTKQLAADSYVTEVSTPEEYAENTAHELYFAAEEKEAAAHHKAAFLNNSFFSQEARQLAEIIKETNKAIQPAAWLTTQELQELDGGTCNLDHCLIFLKGKKKTFIEQVEYLAGLQLVKADHMRQRGWYCVCFDLKGQANLRTEMAEAAAGHLIECGVSATVCYYSN